MTTTMQETLRHWPGMRLTWLGAGAVVHPGPEPSPGAADLVVTPHGSNECAVVISSHSVKMLPGMVEELAEVLANGLPRGFSAMRFIAWDGACMRGDRPSAAHLLSMRLGIDVISAAGPLLGVPGGSLFAPVGRGSHRPGGWWRFRAGAAPVRTGWRFPAPEWEADLGEIPELPGDLVLDHVPAGLWLHRRGVGSITDLAFSVPTDPANPSMILSHPSQEPLQRGELREAIAAVPALTVDRLVFTPYGQRPLADGPVGPAMADLIGRAVHVRTGLPLCAPAGQRAVVTIDDKGLPRWRTFARELWHAPRGTAPRTVDWINPAPDVLTVPAGQATFALGGGWVCEVIEAGIWIRPEQIEPPADWIRSRPVDVNRCAVIIGAPYVPELTPPGHMVAGVLDRMPVDARKRAFIGVPRGAAPNVFALAEALRDQLPEAGDVELLTPMRDVLAVPSVTSSPPQLSQVSSLGEPSVAQHREPEPAHREAEQPQPEPEPVYRLDLPMPPSRYETANRPAPHPIHSTAERLLIERPAAAAHRPVSPAPVGAVPVGDALVGSANAMATPAAVPTAQFAPPMPPTVLPAMSPAAMSPVVPATAAAPTHTTPPLAHMVPTGQTYGAQSGGVQSGGVQSGAQSGAQPVVASNGVYTAATYTAGAVAAASAVPAASAGSAPTNGVYTGGTYTASTYSPLTSEPSTYGPNTYGPMTSGPNVHAPNVHAPSTYAPSPHAANAYPHDTYPREMSSGDVYAANAYAPNTYAPETYSSTPHTNGARTNGAMTNGAHPTNGIVTNGATTYRTGAMAAPVAPVMAAPVMAAPVMPAPGPMAPPVEYGAPSPVETTGSFAAVGADRESGGPDDTGSLSLVPGGREIRSHRTATKAGKAPKRDDDKTSTQELTRLLGFFDEIRRAKAWDEGPAPQEQPAGRSTPSPRRARR